MRINWFSPLPPARTDIANYTARVLPELAARAEVVLLTDRDCWDRALESYAEVRHFRGHEEDWIELNRGDCTFYNIGNDADFHVDIWKTSLRHAGIVILHDLRLHNFFEGFFYHHLNRDVKQYLAVMQRYYGTRGRRDGERWWSSLLPIDVMNERYPLTEFALAGAMAAVVHSSASREARSGVAIPFHELPLPYSPSPRCPGVPTARAGGPIRLVLFGHLGRNRRLDTILDVLAGLPARERFHLDIYGRVEHEADLHAAVCQRGVERVVTYHSFVPEDVLEQALDNADLALNLRYPTAGEASGSQLRIWDHALPSLVSRTGWYAELPEGCVGYVDPQREHDDLRRHLLALATDPAPYQRMGQLGQQVLRQVHRPDRYVEKLLELTALASLNRREAGADRLAARLGQESAALMSPLRARAAQPALAQLVHELLLAPQPLGDSAGHKRLPGAAR